MLLVCPFCFAIVEVACEDGSIVTCPRCTGKFNEMYTEELG